MLKSGQQLLGSRLFSPQLTSSLHHVRRHLSDTKVSSTSEDEDAFAKDLQTASPIKPIIDIKNIRSSYRQYAHVCEQKNYQKVAAHPRLIVEAHERWREREAASIDARKEIKKIESEIRNATNNQKIDIVVKAQSLRRHLDAVDEEQRNFQESMLSLALELPNSISSHTPVGDTPEVIRLGRCALKAKYDPKQDHTQIGQEFGLIDFDAASTTSGFGFYYLRDEAADLEHALVQFALKMAKQAGFQHCSPPSLVYPSIGRACGFQPRTQSGRLEVYESNQHVLTGTGEIPFAGMKANQTIKNHELPQRVVGSSRCYRKEAGSHGRRDRGLYRVHEFTKVEMFAWTMPGQELELFDQMIAVQEEIIRSLDLPYRLIEVASHDLGAPAYRKQDIEVFFPSRKDIAEGWGEVTSTSICTDYQTRRLNTRVTMPQDHNSRLGFPSTLNGTAMAVPRVLAAILEHGWQTDGVITIPKALQPFMDGRNAITRKSV